MKHVFVFDPKAFFNHQWKMDNILDNIGQFFRTQDKPDFSIQFSRYRRNAILLIQEEADKAKPGDVVRIYAIGGDEILFDCLNGVAHFQDMQFAVIPHEGTSDFLSIFGTENLELFTDIPSLVKSSSIPTDVIKWGVNYAMNSCCIGVNSAIAKRVKDMKARLNKRSFIIFSKISTFLNGIITVFNKQSAAKDYIINIDDRDYSGSYSLIHIANGPYYAGKITGVSNATPDDGLLDIALIRASYPLNTLMSLRKYSRGKKPKNGIYVHGKKVSIKSEKNMWIQLDNEFIQDTSIEIDLVHHAVQLVTPNNLSYPSNTAV
ncbi:MAG: hypothetical protein FWC19_08825 [Treponema sp.]|nr:hypothetical protein [Treponema sp.]MCL2272885.1 hypothetical protein [Treponema sp.]